MAEVNLDVAMQSTSEEILDKLNAGMSVIKKVQHLSASASGTVTISPVDTAKSFILINQDNANYVNTTVTFASSTQVTVSEGKAEFSVVEFY